MAKIPLPTYWWNFTRRIYDSTRYITSNFIKKTTISLEQIDNILHNKLVINANISQQLGQVFHVSDNYFLKLQKDINERK